jgi:hypothetical protein
VTTTLLNFPKAERESETQKYQDKILKLLSLSEILLGNTSKTSVA